MRKKIERLFFKIKLFFFSSLFIFIIGIVVFVIQFEKHFIPTATLFSEKFATNVISSQINESVQEVIEELELSKLNFFENYYQDSNGKNYFSVNNVLINNICAEISSNLSTRLNQIKENKINLPIGNLTGLSIFSNIGPSIKISINSMGDAIVDYETKFESVGINQLNFQVWLQINTQIVIVNNLYSKEINVKRNLMLVNIVFNGDVPNTYFNTDEYGTLNLPKN